MPGLLLPPQPELPPTAKLRELVRRTYKFEWLLARNRGQDCVFKFYASRPTVVMHISDITDWKLFGQYIPENDPDPVSV